MSLSHCEFNRVDGHQGFVFLLHRKYHKSIKNITVNLSDSQNKTQTQLFIEAYKQIASQGALDNEKIFEVAEDIVRDKMKERFESRKESVGLVKSFEAATEEQKHPKSMVDIKNIFD